MADAGPLLVATIRWDATRGYDGERAAIDRALALGVGGFVVHGGTDMAVRALTAELQRRSKLPLLIGAEMERGAGHQFNGATTLPPLAAIASLGGVDDVRRAARITAREARALGVNWCLAPVCDPAIAPSLVAEWIDACQAEGVLACARDFPGRRAPATDVQVSLPFGAADDDASSRESLPSFVAAIDAGVASTMLSASAFPAFDASGAPATLSRSIATDLLRGELGFDGVVVSGSLARAAESEPPESVAARAVAAGCDLLAGAPDLAAAARSIESAIDDERLRTSRERRARWAAWAAPSSFARDESRERHDRDWARLLVERWSNVDR